MKTNLRAMSSELEPNALLELAKNADLADVVICGTMEDGSFYSSAANLDISEAVALIEIVKAQLIHYLMTGEIVGDGDDP